jgi:hypothetical protein
VNALFHQLDVLASGDLLPGAYDATVPLLVTGALATWSAGSGTLSLEIDGDATGDTFVLGSGTGRTVEAFAFEEPVAALGVIRLRVAGGGFGEGARLAVQLDLAADPDPTPALTVDYVAGDERTTLYTFAAGTFTAVDSTRLPGRAAIREDGGVVGAFGAAWAEAYDGALWAAAFKEGAAASSPRLEFLRGGRLLGAVGAEGIFGPGFTELTTAPAVPADGFSFAQAGTVIAVLTRAGWRATGFGANA